MSQFFQHYGPQILARASEHLWVSLLAVTFAVLLGVPLGLFAARNDNWRAPILGFANLAQTVPLLALLGLLLPIFGFGLGDALVALVIYASLPIIRDTCDGLRNVDAGVRESAHALGMTPSQIFRRVELPLAAASIVSGIRTATVLSIGITTIAAFFGAGGLGDLILGGVRTHDNAMIMAGAIPVALLALGANWALGRWQKILAAQGAGRAKSARPRRVITVG